MKNPSTKIQTICLILVALLGRLTLTQPEVGEKFFNIEYQKLSEPPGQTLQEYKTKNQNVLMQTKTFLWCLHVKTVNQIKRWQNILVWLQQFISMLKNQKP